ncbi:hypothetical protein D1831_03425 [Lactiplantibacillus garii]|uniref:Sce7725 family protein n=1 Tax=Lactiplantibacillus garii TaxID=2306423 RepID=A0A426D9K0_9LACO|nr:sce7725 family protein [Lactiplantibacillus garii]RRK11290.1 hypothetical protein D1831_03425 [Lactiplantibacillus garii]
MSLYTPYFRGRMYDLLALKTLAEQHRLGPHVVPIIEPVRDSKELQQTVATFIKVRQPFSLIANPQVSVYGLNPNKLHPLPDLSPYPFFHPAAILAADFSRDFLTTTTGQTSFLIAPNYPLLKAYEHSAILKRTTLVIPDEARLHQIAGNQAILLTDPVATPHHVADYGLLTDEYFAPANWDNAPFGYQGFGDFSLVGKPYFDRGMPSRAIALHVIYVTRNGTLRIHHCVSDSNTSMRGQKQKFSEALAKLTAWAPTHLTGLNRTPALDELLAYGNLRKFSGLGTVKKLSLMHHLQLMHRLLGD